MIYVPDTSLYLEKKSAYKKKHTERERHEEERMMHFTFTCFAFLPLWMTMTFHFLARVISKGLIQFALQAVFNPHSLYFFLYSVASKLAV